jgi:hypothetical protein
MANLVHRGEIGFMGKIQRRADVLQCELNFPVISHKCWAPIVAESSNAPLMVKLGSRMLANTLYRGRAQIRAQLDVVIDAATQKLSLGASRTNSCGDVMLPLPGLFYAAITLGPSSARANFRT